MLRAVSPPQADTGDAELGRRVRERREALHLSQAGLGSLMRPQRSQGWVSNVETGARGTDLAGLRDLATALDTTVAELLGEPTLPRPVTEQWAMLSPTDQERFSEALTFLMEKFGTANEPEEEEPPA